MLLAYDQLRDSVSGSQHPASVRRFFSAPHFFFETTIAVVTELLCNASLHNRRMRDTESRHDGFGICFIE